VLYSLYGIRELGLTPVSLGLTIAMGGAGDLLGALLAGPAVRRFGLGPTLLAATLASSAAGLLIPLAGSFSGRMAAVLGLMFTSQLIGDGLRSIYTINEVSLRQAITPDRLLGRVNASINLLVGGVGPLGALLGGLLGSVIGTRDTLWVASLGGMLSIIWLIFSPIPRLKDHETLPTPPFS
jgi:MFS family permease